MIKWSIFLSLKYDTPVKCIRSHATEIKNHFDYFDYVYVSFSGGKDSGVLLNLCIDYLRKHEPGRKLGVFHMDYEAQYRQTTEYVEQTLASHPDMLEVYHCCVPFKDFHLHFHVPILLASVGRRASVDIWVREKAPKIVIRPKTSSFSTRNYGTMISNTLFAPWLRMQKKCKRVCCLVGIRTQESFNRWRSIHSDRNYKRLAYYKWTHRLDHHIYNAYPIYDWKTTDIWTANGKFQWTYNHLYDLYYQAGIPIAHQRVASPFISQAISALKVYRIIDPDTWGKNVRQSQRSKLCRYVWPYHGNGVEDD